MELWKDIQGYEGYYQVSNEGRVKSLERDVEWRGTIRHQSERILKESTHNRGYKRVRLCDGKSNIKLVHRLVAEAFIPNPNNYPMINHKDENPSNNRVENLEWCTAQYNNTYNDRHIKCAAKIAKSKSGLKPSDEARKHMSEAQKNRYINGEIPWNKGLPNCRRKPVVKYDIKTREEIESFECIRQAALLTKCADGHISQCCNGKRKTCGGFGWKYA